MGVYRQIYFYLISSFHFYSCSQSFSNKNRFKGVYYKYFRSQGVNGTYVFVPFFRRWASVLCPLFTWLWCQPENTTCKEGRWLSIKQREYRSWKQRSVPGSAVWCQAISIELNLFVSPVVFTQAYRYASGGRFKGETPFWTWKQCHITGCIFCHIQFMFNPSPWCSFRVAPPLHSFQLCM